MRISVSKANLVFTQLKPPISVLSKAVTCSAFVGNAIQHLLLSLWTQPLKGLSELHFWGLYLNSFCRCVALCSNISQSIIASWKL